MTEELRKMSTEDLDEFVHNMKGEEAAVINNAGKDAQIEYLEGELHGRGRTKTKTQLNDLNDKAANAVKGLLRYSFFDVDFDFEALTAEEKEVVGSKETMDEIVEWAGPGQIPRTWRSHDR